MSDINCIICGTATKRGTAFWVEDQPYCVDCWIPRFANETYLVALHGPNWKQAYIDAFRIKKTGFSPSRMANSRVGIATT